MTGYKKTLILLVISLPLFVATNTQASTSKVHVVTEGNSNSTVKINNSVESTSTTTTDTHVRIENNGEVTEYHSDKPEDIHIESSDGNSKIDIKNGSTTVTPATTSADQDEDHDDPDKDKKDNTVKESKNIIEVIVNFFKNLFNLGN